MESTTKIDATPSSVGIRYGLLTGLVSILITFGLNVAHLEASPLKYLTTIVMIVGIILAQRDFKQRNEGFMSYGQGVGIGVITSTVLGVISAIFTYVYTAFVDPEIMTRAMNKARADLEAKGNLSDAQIDQAMALSSKFTSGPILWVLVIVGSIVIGLIISLITAAVLKNAKPEFE
ncbi:MAG: DUF4199 domain-containing protein [Hymenobacter sp.]|nr:MAG: DUF4199 domain-containing protein [Hymenobacter sp.]